MIRSESDWENLRSKVQGPTPKIIPKPNVDFSQNSLIGVFAGLKTTGGYSIKVTRVMEDDEKLTVFVEEVSPGKSCLVTQAITFPYQFVKIPRTNKEADFQVQQITRECQ